MEHYVTHVRFFPLNIMRDEGFVSERGFSMVFCTKHTHCKGSTGLLINDDAYSRCKERKGGF